MHGHVRYSNIKCPQERTKLWLSKGAADINTCLTWWFDPWNNPLKTWNIWRSFSRISIESTIVNKCYHIRSTFLTSGRNKILSAFCSSVDYWTISIKQLSTSHIGLVISLSPVECLCRSSRFPHPGLPKYKLKLSDIMPKFWRTSAVPFPK